MTSKPRAAAITRRTALRAVLATTGASLLPRPLAAEAGGAHGFSPLGVLRYPPGFSAFDYVRPDAPKGGTLRLARSGAFDTVDTLHYPGRPPDDIRLIYDRLFVPSDDEPASYYGLLAERIAVADDYTRIDLALSPRARWHDGTPVTAADVVFTFETLKSRGAPFYRQAFRPLTVSAADERRVTITNARKGDRDLLRRLSTIPIHPAHVWRGEGPRDAAGLVGSGPYRVAVVEPPRRLVLARVADYWARDHPVNRGRWNFDRLVFEFRRDATVSLEAFRADEHDVRFEDDPTRWANGYAGPALSAGRIRRTETDGAGPGTLHGLVFNLRRPVLADRRVRRALTLLFDFDAVNRNLFAGGHQRFASVFADTALEARGTMSAAERAVLGDAAKALPAAALDTPDPLAGDPSPGSRAALRTASALLDAAGFPVEGGVRVDAAGRPLTLAVLSPSPAYDRPLAWLENAARRVGVGLSRIQADPTAASRRMLDKDFDLATLSWAPARLPGTAERLLWHSELAIAPNSYALSGLEDRAVDTAIEALERARSPGALEAAGRAFDRSFRHTLAILPLWRADTVRLAWWDRFGRPEETGLPPSPMDRWWSLETAR